MKHYFTFERCVYLKKKKIGKKQAHRNYMSTMKNEIVYDINRYILLGKMLINIMNVICLRYVCACLVFFRFVLCIV